MSEKEVVGSPDCLLSGMQAMKDELNGIATGSHYSLIKLWGNLAFRTSLNTIVLLFSACVQQGHGAVGGGKSQGVGPYY